MPVRFLGPRPPVLLTDSAGTFWYWTAGRGMPQDRVERSAAVSGHKNKYAQFSHSAGKQNGAAQVHLSGAGGVQAQLGVFTLHHPDGR